MRRRKIAVVTGSRADYGLLHWVIRGVMDDPALELQLIVAAMHLSPEFGLTYRQIEQDGIPISAKVEMLLSGDTPSAIAKSIGLGTIGFADAYDRLRPEISLLLGDRFETLAAAQAALVARVPIAHIHGGEATEGAFDEAIRHSVTKMSSFHFVAAEPFRRRVIQLGEWPERVFNVGAPGLDNIRRLALLDRDRLEEALGFSLGNLSFIVTYHPATLGEHPPQQAMQQVLEALDGFPDAQIILTYPNADTAGRALIPQIERYAAANPGRVLSTASLGQLQYLSALRHVDVVIGNSSSGLIEAPSFKTATVNIGARQQARLRGTSVIDCDESADSIGRAVRQALSTTFQKTIGNVVNPYGDGKTSPRIVTELRRADLRGVALKRFNDLSFPIASQVAAG